MPTEARTVRAVGDASLAWSASEYLLAMVVDALNGANWQRGGGKGKRPKPIPRPGRDDEDESDKKTQRWGVAMSIEDYRRRMHPEEFGDVVDVPDPHTPPGEVTIVGS